MDPAILIGAGAATVGWLYTARRARSLSRKQHTVNVMLQASFNKEFREAFVALSPHIRAGKCPDFAKDEALWQHFRFVLNHYEFLAAGLRNGDFDEQLVRDSERGTIVALFDTCQEHIWSLRNTRQRQTIYEHLDWLHGRWQREPPGKLQALVERIIARPFAGKRANPNAR